MGSWSEVLANVPKYRGNEPEPTPDVPNLWEPNTSKLLQAVDDCYDNSGLDPSNGGLFYLFTERGVNDWFKEFVIGNPQYSVSAIQNSLKCWGEVKTVGKPYDPRMAAGAGKLGW